MGVRCCSLLSSSLLPCRLIQRLHATIARVLREHAHNVIVALSAMVLQQVWLPWIRAPLHRAKVDEQLGQWTCVAHARERIDVVSNIMCVCMST